MDTALAMILAGGRGSRMKAFCRDRAKPSLPFAGGARVIDFTLSNCIDSLLPDVAVLLDYQRESMADYLETWAAEHTNDTELSIIEPRHRSFSGTADAVFQNLDFLRRHPAERVIVLAGDHIYRMNYQKLLAYHRQTGADATVAVMPVPLEDAHRFGVVTVDGRIRVSGFVEKPRHPSGNLVSMGIYVFSKDLLIRRLAEDALDPGSSHDFGHDIIPKMIAHDKVAAFRYRGYWRDIGTPPAYYESSMDFLPSASRHGCEKCGRVLTGTRDDAPSHIYPQAKVINSIVSPGCVIKGLVSNSVLSPGVTVEEGAVVRDSVLMTGSIIGERCHIEGCLIGEDVYVDAHCRLGPVNAARSELRYAAITQAGKITKPIVIGSGSRVLSYHGTVDFKGGTVRSGGGSGRGAYIIAGEAGENSVRAA